ncbi:9935_t:CDS:1, partial [Dentiscutata heterogama]
EGSLSSLLVQSFDEPFTDQPNSLVLENANDVNENKLFKRLGCIGGSKK